MTLDDVNYVNMTIPDAKAGLDGGSVDVALLAGATAYNAEQQGYHLVADGEGLISALIAVATTQKFYDEHPDVIKKLTLHRKRSHPTWLITRRQPWRLLPQHLTLMLTR